MEEKVLVERYTMCLGNRIEKEIRKEDVKEVKKEIQNNKVVFFKATKRGELKKVFLNEFSLEETLETIVGNKFILSLPQKG